MRSAHALFALASLALGIAVITDAVSITGVWQEPLHPRTYPLVLGAILVVVGALNAVPRRVAPSGTFEPVGRSAAATPHDRLRRWAPWFVVVLSGGYIVAMTRVGFYLSTFFFCVVLLALLFTVSENALPGRRRWLVILSYGAGFVVAVFLMFTSLRIYLP